MRSFYESFLAALVSFTRIPVRRPLPDAAFRNAVWHLPTLGALLLSLQAPVLWLFSGPQPNPVRAGLLLLLPILFTGALHEDGLADVWDAVGATSDRDRRLEIMKDPRIGSFGVLALIMTLGLSWACLSSIPEHLLLPALLVSQTGSRWVALAIVSRLPYLTRKDSRAAAYLPQPGLSLGFWGATCLVIAVTLLCLPLPQALLALVLSICLQQLAWAYLRKHFGAYTGDFLGAIIKMSELSLLLFFFWAFRS